MSEVTLVFEDSALNNNHNGHLDHENGPSESLQDLKKSLANGGKTMTAPAPDLLCNGATTTNMDSNESLDMYDKPNENTLMVENSGDPPGNLIIINETENEVTNSPEINEQQQRVISEESLHSGTSEQTSTSTSLLSGPDEKPENIKIPNNTPIVYLSNSLPILNQNETHQDLNQHHVPSNPCVQNSMSQNSTDKCLSLDELTDKLLNDTSPVHAPGLLTGNRKNFTPSASSDDVSTRTSSPVSNNKADSNTQDSSRSSSTSLGINGISGSILNHPAYKTAIQDLLAMREQVGALRGQCDRLEKEKQELIADRSPEIFQLQSETLERTVGQQARQLEEAKIEAVKQEEAAVAAIANVKIQLEKLKKEYSEADREREATVVRYAVSERERDKCKQEIHNLEKRLLESGRERDSLLIKLKQAATEKSKACQTLDTKIAEFTGQSRELEKLKDEINAKDIKIKWAQNKIRSEMETHKETQYKLDKITLKLQAAHEETEHIKQECQAVVKSCQKGKEDRNQAIELQVQEQKAQLITERQMRQDAEDARKTALAEADTAKMRTQQLLEENNVLSLKVQQLEQERLMTEQRLSTFQSSEERRCQLEADIEALTLQLQQQQDRSESSKSEVDRLRQSSAELTQDAASCREREAELLAYTQKLTDKVVRLQSESSALESRVLLVEAEREPLTRRVSELESQLATCEASLASEKAVRLEESQLLTRRLAEKQEWGERLAKQLEEARGEVAVLKRKQAQSTKELTRELQQYRRKLQQVEGASAPLSQNSLSGSSSSLNAVDIPSSSASVTSDQAKESAQAAANLGLDPQMLVSRILKLQQRAARQQEKVDFLEEHNRTLLAEVQKKARLVQGFILSNEAGALSSRASDRNKAELSRHGGVMASLFTAAPTDDSMTLELSLEINRKLQAVLEDTLLKNITLKENLDTLSQEIERLSNLQKTSRLPS